MIKDITPEMGEEIKSLLLKLARKSKPLEHYLTLEEAVHCGPCKIEDGCICFSYQLADGSAVSYRGRSRDKSPIRAGFLFTVLSSHLAEFAAAFSGKTVKALPVREPDLTTPLGNKFQQELAAIAEQLQARRKDLLQASTEEEKAAQAQQVERCIKSVNRETVRFFGLTKHEVKLLKTVMEY